MARLLRRVLFPRPPFRFPPPERGAPERPRVRQQPRYPIDRQAYAGTRELLLVWLAGVACGMAVMLASAAYFWGSP